MLLNGVLCVKDGLFSEDEVERIGREANPGESVLRAWSNRGQSVRDLLVRLQALSKRHGAAMDQAQLILSRKFSESTQ
ncbi:hypothetical protein ANCDUO_13063 [Ancylostoma duodenale]|uniref:Death domain-containing protein n=1 Tax=Ancylostoma duodenale TaxID=51022 RepID=A0A0C2D3Z4_9BILA|nr:hypothetical protein ANCDUO_13063 [Ancylostoma duodenale]